MVTNHELEHAFKREWEEKVGREPIAYVLIETKANMLREVFKHLLMIPEVLEVHPILGAYDIIAKIKCEEDGEVKVTRNKIRKIKGVTKTETLITTIL
jgi:DNA-binding Lrp family transcriptional regulator